MVFIQIVHMLCRLHIAFNNMFILFLLCHADVNGAMNIARKLIPAFNIETIKNSDKSSKIKQLFFKGKFICSFKAIVSKLIREKWRFPFS